MSSTTFVDLSRFQFATTAAFHMTFPALSVGLAIFLVICYGAYCRTSNPVYLQMFRFWRKISATSRFSWIYPAAGVEALAVVRTAARYGERLITHGTTLQMLARLRARVFASATLMVPRQLRRFHSGDLLDRLQAD